MKSRKDESFDLFQVTASWAIHVALAAPSVWLINRIGIEKNLMTQIVFLGAGCVVFAVSDVDNRIRIKFSHLSALVMVAI